MIEAYLGSGIDAPLVLVGKKAWKSEQELQPYANFIHPPGTGPTAGRRVIQFDYQPRPLLLGLIRAAKAVLFPSLYEGFGLPVLEAMLLETAVMTSTEGALPEVAGDAAVLVDPYSARAMAEAIRSLDTNAELRADLVVRGAKQAKLFSPSDYNERVQRLYDRLK